MTDDLPIENCAGCGKKTEQQEWLMGLPSPGVSTLLEGLIRFTCSVCGHEMYSGFLKDKL